MRIYRIPKNRYRPKLLVDSSTEYFGSTETTVELKFNLLDSDEHSLRLEISLSEQLDLVRHVYENHPNEFKGLIGQLKKAGRK